MIRRTPDLDDLDREIRDHIEHETEDNVARGMSEEAARAAAIRKFGNVTRVKEDVRGVWIPLWLDSLRQDLRDAFRQVRRDPAFAAAIVVTLGLGIGLTTTIFSVVNAMLIRPLDFPDPDRVVWLTTRGVNAGNEDMNSIVFAGWQEAATSFEQMVAYGYSDATMVLGGQGSRMRIVNASEGFWSATGAQAFLGALPPANNREVIVLAHHAYRERFGGDPGIIGRAVTIDGRAAVIGGVLPEGFAPQLPAPAFRPGLEQAQPDAYRGWVVPPAPAVITPSTGAMMYHAFARLKPGVSIAQAREEVATIHRRRPTFGGPSMPVIIPLREKLVGASRVALQLLLSAAAVLLTITCVNVANLLLARSSARQREIALRMSVGGGPLRIVRQLLVESLSYAFAGAIGGVALASWLVGAVIKLVGPSVPRLSETTLDLNVLAFAMAVAGTSALLFGIGPAISLCRTRVQDVLKDGARTASASPRALMMGRLMMTMQVSLTVVLLVGAGLLLKSVARLTAYPPGFSPEQILTLRVDIRGQQYRDEPTRRNYVRNILAAAGAVPGVRDVALTTGQESFMIVIKEGQPFPEDRDAHESAVSAVSADLGRILGMTLVSGRWFTEVDFRGAMVVNEAFARQEFPEGNAIGQRIRLPWAKEDRFATVVGVAADMKFMRLDQEVGPEVFVHHADAPLNGMTMLIRFESDPTPAISSTLKALSQIDPTQSFFSVRTMDEALAESIAPRRFNLLLLGAFALSALFLAVLGVYGVVAYAVAERTREIGIRLALGAERARVVRSIIGQGMVSVVTGVIAGLIGAVLAARLIATLLYGVDAHDAPTFAIATVLLTTIAFMACAAPALRAAFVDPVVALRAE